MKRKLRTTRKKGKQRSTMDDRDVRAVADALAESIADALMVYGAHDEDCTPGKPCRVCFRQDISAYVLNLAERVMDERFDSLREELELVKRAHKVYKVEAVRLQTRVNSAAIALLQELQLKRSQVDGEPPTSAPVEDKLRHELHLLRKGVFDTPDNGTAWEREITPEDLEAGKHGRLAPLLQHIRHVWESEPRDRKRPYCGEIQVANRRRFGEIRVKLLTPLLIEALCQVMDEAEATVSDLDYFDCVKE